MRPLRVLTWHVHGSYLYYLSHVPVDFILPLKQGRPEGYGGRAGRTDWPPNLHEVPAEEIRSIELDAVLFQSRKNWLEDQYEILSPWQRRLPRIYLEHDPPIEHPAATRHVVDDRDVLLVHVTPFNALMWDAGCTPTTVIDHGVTVPAGVRYTGELPRGITVVNNIARRGRRLGADIFEQARAELPLDLVGMGAEDLGGLGEVRHDALPPFQARYRFFFNPIRYTSMGLAVCEAMMLGMPIVGLATTEMAVAIEDGVSGYVDTNPVRLVGRMKHLIEDPGLARELGDGARRYALERFNIQRFAADWLAALSEVCGQRLDVTANQQVTAGGGG